MEHKRTCSMKVRRPRGLWGGSPCGKRATIEEDGKWWCPVHAPSRVKVRREKRGQRWDAERKAREERYQKEAEAQAFADAAVSACSGLPTIMLAALPVGAVAKVVEAGKTAAEVERPEEMVTAADYNGLPRWARSYIAELEEAKYGVTAALAPFTQEVPANGNH